MRALIISVAVVVVSGCGCTSNSNGDGGNPLDGGADAGPKHCMVSTDCGADTLVCDPGSKVCVSKCTDDQGCATLGGVCTLEDGTCRPPCDQVDGGEGYCSDFMKLCQPTSGHCIAKCSNDDDCATIDPGKLCVSATGRCVNGAHGCNMDTDCNNPTWFDSTDPCWVGGSGCRCLTEVNDAGSSGICVRRHAPCEACTSDAQCGNTQQFDPMGACNTLPNDTSGKKYCEYQHPSGPCGCGYVDDLHGTCIPSTGTCDMPGCGKDSDCSNGNVCNTQLCHCEPRCRWDFATQTLAAPGCPSNETCWVDTENLDPTSIFYGSGRCHAPCADDTECNTSSAANPHGGPNLKCASEKTAGGAMSDKRCRANGDCMDDLECPQLPDTSLSYGYCDKGSFDCQTDCRVGQNPQTGQSYDDCRPPYGCASDGGTNFCKLKTCLESGGASIACRLGQYCCGEDKDNDGNPDPCPPANEMDDQLCYYAPAPPFCQQCSGMPDDCKNFTLPTWLQNACSNGSQSPDCSPFAMLCYQYTNPQTMAMVGLCAPSSLNDSSLDSHMRRTDSKGCPKGFSAVYHRISFTMGAEDNCTADSDCNVGTTSGRCATDPTDLLADGGHPKSCLCTVGSSTAQCPNDADAGVFSQCRTGNTGDTQACVDAVSCFAPASYVFAKDAGCGL